MLALETGLMPRKQVDVVAAPRDVFERLTTVKGVQQFFAPKGLVQLVVNGAVRAVPPSRPMNS